MSDPVTICRCAECSAELPHSILEALPGQAILVCSNECAMAWGQAKAGAPWYGIPAPGEETD